jgi:hypothetical protein
MRGMEDKTSISSLSVKTVNVHDHVPTVARPQPNKGKAVYGHVHVHDHGHVHGDEYCAQHTLERWWSTPSACQAAQ